ncbi:Hypothetical predicted protein [Marmota monax]|uniref:Uncharacterized protein n=1 Tax=Marmota monax TaxID=9995 RepID=A0A5E4CF20_MARMO|nr:hypothetical protein GHT09_010945 [Marmota monax]VTJ80477.1 Hypothetical predicted protein [Marmota monax]
MENSAGPFCYLRIPHPVTFAARADLWGQPSNSVARAAESPSRPRGVEGPPELHQDPATEAGRRHSAAPDLSHQEGAASPPVFGRAPLSPPAEASDASLLPAQKAHASATSPRVPAPVTWRCGGGAKVRSRRVGEEERGERGRQSGERKVREARSGSETRESVRHCGPEKRRARGEEERASVKDWPLPLTAEREALFVVSQRAAAAAAAETIIRRGRQLTAVSARGEAQAAAAVAAAAPLGLR